MDNSRNPIIMKLPSPLETLKLARVERVRKYEQANKKGVLEAHVNHVRRAHK